jgi:hypothetical protein
MPASARVFWFSKNGALRVFRWQETVVRFIALAQTTICSRHLPGANQGLKVLLFVSPGRRRQLEILADFVAEQLALLATRDFMRVRRVG